METSSKKNDIIVVLPNIRSAHNVGAFFRTADAIGVSKIYLVGWTPEPGHKGLDKVSLGAEQVIPWERRKTLGPLLKKFKKNGYHIVALEESPKSIDYRTWKPKFPMVLVVGNEVDGLKPAQLKYCDTTVHLPMLGMKKSLNVSVAFGAIAYYILPYAQQ